MQLRNLTLSNFRNYTHLELALPETNLVIFRGENAQGKTNLLESIYVSINGKSFRTNSVFELINWDAHAASIIAEFHHEENNIRRQIILREDPPHKSLKHDNKSAHTSQFIRQIPVALFFPEDMQFMSATPDYRRRYLDRILSQISTDYLENRLKLSHILKQRNALLKQIEYTPDWKTELEVWDQELANCSAFITRERRVLVDRLNQRFPQWYGEIASSNRHVPRLTYRPSFDSEENEKWTKALFDQQKRDVSLRTTTLGPHRDDIVCFFNQKETVSAASRGEHRSFLLSLKRCELEYLHDQTGISPILLLDDVFSELDHRRQKSLLPLIDDFQTFLTCTTTPESMDDRGTLYEIHEGKVVR